MNRQNRLPQKTPAEINHILKKRELEDIYVLKQVENILLKKRGYIFRMPKPKTPVISLMSGGLDTTIITAMLIKEFDLDIYPVYFDRGINLSKKSSESVNYFAKFFLNIFPNNFHKPQVLSLKIPPREITKYLEPGNGKIKVRDNSEQKRGVPFQPSAYAYNALLYAIYLQEQFHIKIRDVFGAWLPSNSEWFAYESLTSLRLIMLDLCLMTLDYSWQFTSLPMEKELGFFFDKDFLIAWGTKNNVPLERTWSCSKKSRLQCGVCSNCLVRRKAYMQTKIRDKTFYKSEQISLANKIRNKTKRILNKTLYG